MSTNLRLFWMTEACCYAGVPVTVEDLELPLRERVCELAQGDRVTLVLPFLDLREWRRRGEVLRGLTLVREGQVIHSVAPSVGADLRNRAAYLLATDAAWMNTAGERTPHYFETWQDVSLTLQRSLRQWIPESHFRDIERYEDRDTAYPLVVYAASRICPGRPRTEFTFDLADPDALAESLRMIGRSLREVLAQVEQRLRAANKPALARRYAPVWHEDIRRAVIARPRRLLEVLAREAALIDAVIRLGTSREMTAVKPFAKTTGTALRQMYGHDLRCLGPRILETTTQSLRETISRFPPPATHPASLAADTFYRYKPDSEVYR
jgi:hypothetical protein